MKGKRILFMVLLLAAESEPNFAALPWRKLDAVQSERVLRVPAEAIRLNGMSAFCQPLHGDGAAVWRHGKNR